MNTKNKTYLDEFISYLINERRYSNNTTIAYTNDITNYIDFIEREQFGNIDEISPKVAEFYIGYLRDNFTPKSIQRKASSLKAMYHYLVDIMKEVPLNPFIGVPLPKVEKRLPKIAYENEIDEFLNKIDTEDDKGKRDKLIFTLLYGSGLRVSELTDIKLRDLNLEERTLVVHGKGSKDRIVPINNSTKELFKDYLTIARPTFLSRSNNLDNDSIFLNFKGTSLTSRGVRDILSSCLTKTCSTMKVSPHTFRHSFATHLLNQGMDVRMVQELLGHSNLSTTQIYTKISKESLQEAYNKAFPKGDDHHD